MLCAPRRHALPPVASRLLTCPGGARRTAGRPGARASGPSSFAAGPARGAQTAPAARTTPARRPQRSAPRPPGPGRWARAGRTTEQQQQKRRRRRGEASAPRAWLRQRRVGCRWTRQAGRLGAARAPGSGRRRVEPSGCWPGAPRPCPRPPRRWRAAASQSRCVPPRPPQPPAPTAPPARCTWAHKWGTPRATSGVSLTGLALATRAHAPPPTVAAGPSPVDRAVQLHQPFLHQGVKQRAQLVARAVVPVIARQGARQQEESVARERTRGDARAFCVRRPPQATDLGALPLDEASSKVCMRSSEMPSVPDAASVESTRARCGAARRSWAAWRRSSSSAPRKCRMASMESSFLRPTTSCARSRTWCAGRDQGRPTLCHRVWHPIDQHHAPRGSAACARGRPGAGRSACARGPPRSPPALGPGVARRWPRAAPRCPR